MLTLPMPNAPSTASTSGESDTSELTDPEQSVFYAGRARPLNCEKAACRSL
jgi:hypothetical protein